MTDEFVIKGEWFLPSKKDSRINGMLTYRPREGTGLELYGSFDENNFLSEFKDQEIILGLSSDSKQVTLYKCYMTNREGTMAMLQDEETGKPSVSYSIGYILIGLHVNSQDDLKFNRISSEIFNLEEWVGITGFINKPPDLEKIKNGEVSVEYKLPKAIEFPIDHETNGKFAFFVTYPGQTRFKKSTKIIQRIELQVDTNLEKSLEALLLYLVRFQNFLSLALYRSTYPLSITLSGDSHKKDFGDGKPSRKQIKFFFSSSNFRVNEKPKSDMEMIFDLRRLKADFPGIIKNWFSKYELLEPAFDLVLEQFYNGSRFNINTFLNLAQSAETFHARVHNHTRIPKADYKIMKEEILKISPKEYHTWLIDQFSFGNSLHLQSRLTEITDKYSNRFIDKILGDKEQFVLNVKHSRNYYTHYSKDGGKNALKGSDLFYLSEKLKILLVCSFLIEIGIDKEALTTSLDNLKWSLFTHFNDWQ